MNEANSVSNYVKEFTEAGNIRVEYKHTSINLDLYKKIIQWGKYGLNAMISRCEEDEECTRYKVIEQGMGILGNALVSYSFTKKKYSVVPDPVIMNKSESCILNKGNRYDVAVSVKNNFLLLIEVKLYRKTSENIPPFPNIDEVYDENPNPRKIFEKCSAVPVGILLELNKPKNTRMPYYIVEINKVSRKKAHESIYASIVKWCDKWKIPLATA